MKKFKLSTVALLSVAVLYVGLSTPTSQEYSKERIQHTFSVMYGHGQGI
ncbi:hypothetical protein [Priestia taiwanensis]|uniref:Uncharacterized protein n=1 Tax=Priestia taiwanensis TaxID=1347902 RepID=A0A917ALB7_9BACI|nr:hypothetical protein [Priestia taiwanensis]MBM7362207.1 hypothetical protein [Priestia taiwanensis]GGE60264.1 hypothetical protein GCM10007140_08290 [Priestia taiwanensis]